MPAESLSLLVRPSPGAPSRRVRTSHGHLVVVIDSDLSGNSLSLARGSTESRRLRALQTSFGLFDGFVALEVLDLSDNNFGTLEQGVFEDLGALESLCVSLERAGCV